MPDYRRCYFDGSERNLIVLSDLMALPGGATHSRLIHQGKQSLKYLAWFWHGRRDGYIYENIERRFGDLGLNVSGP